MLERDRDLALGAAAETGLEEPGVDLVDERRRGRDRGDLPLVLDRPQSLHQTARRQELDAAGRVLGEAGGGARSSGASSNPTRRRVEPAASASSSSPRDDLALERRIDLHARLRRVAEVGEEAALAGGADKREPAAPGVTGEVAEVRGAVDDQRVQLLRGEQLAQAARGARRSPVELLGEPRERLAVALDALPATHARTRSRTTEVARQASRSSIFERWTSTAGSPVSSSASWIAHE